MAAQMSSWLVSVFSPLATLSEDVLDNITRCDLESESNSKTSKCDSQVLQSFDHVFKLFYIEYSTVSIGILLIMWNKIMSSKYDGTDFPTQINKDCVRENQLVKYGIWVISILSGIGIFAALVSAESSKTLDDSTE